MKILKIDGSNLEPMLEMAKLTKKYADKSRCRNFGEYIYFSEVQAGHSPRIKFYGGTAETRSTKDAPSYTITRNGAGSLELERWMTKKNCPNAFDEDYLSGVHSFINDHTAILLLIWFCKLDEADGLAYFQGLTNWKELIDDIRCDDKLLSALKLVADEYELHKFCLDNNLYSF